MLTTVTNNLYLYSFRILEVDQMTFEPKTLAHTIKCQTHSGVVTVNSNRVRVA
jgi:hypothetical protein